MAPTKLLESVRALDTYENIVIGNFFLALGVELGLNHEHSPISPISANLLQQTTLDTRLGDALIFNSSFFRLIEFKRASNDSVKEQAKLQILQTALAGNASHLREISRRIHWYVKSDTSLGLKTWVVPYLEFLDLNSAEVLSHTDLLGFVKETAKQACSRTKLSAQEIESFRLYLDLVYHSHGSSSAASGALFLQVVQGKLQYLVVPDILDILRTPRQILQRAEQINLALSKDTQIQEELSNKAKLSQEQKIRDPGFGKRF